MEQSTLHIKAPSQLHIATKVQAAKLSKTMNQYILDLITQDLTKNGNGFDSIYAGRVWGKSKTPDTNIKYEPMEPSI